MKPSSFAFACLLLALSITGAAATADPRSDLVVDAKWLAAHVKDPGIVLLHVGDADEYAAGHIPGARHVTLDDVSVSEHTKTGLMLEMPATEDLRARLQKLGISDDSTIVVYYGKDWVSPSTRVVFTLQYAGLADQTKLLDGGMGAWVRAGGTLSKDAPSAQSGKLSPLHVQPIVVDAAFVHSHAGAKGFAVVDARNTEFYDGSQNNQHMNEKQRAGHIHGALSLPFVDPYDDLSLKRPAALQALFTKAGVKPHDTVIAYCHIGMQATALLFAAQSLGHPVLLYDGSFQDWSRHTEYAVDNPSKK